MTQSTGPIVLGIGPGSDISQLITFGLDPTGGGGPPIGVGNYPMIVLGIGGSADLAQLITMGFETGGVGPIPPTPAVTQTYPPGGYNPKRKRKQQREIEAKEAQVRARQAQREGAPARRAAPAAPSENFAERQRRIKTALKLTRVRSGLRGEDDET
jgi:hypothetical protein